MFTRLELGRDSYLDIAEQWLTLDEADHLMDQLTRELVWEQRANVVYGKTIPHARLMAWAGDIPYAFSGQTLEPRDFKPTLKTIHDRVCADVNEAFNHVILNRYPDGSYYIGPHADNEPELGQDPLIAALSLGSTRKFVLTSKRKKTYTKKIALTHGSLIVMGGRFQHRWRHEIPKQPHITEPRINLTFRTLRGLPGWRSWEPETHHLALDSHA